MLKASKSLFSIGKNVTGWVEQQEKVTLVERQKAFISDKGRKYTLRLSERQGFIIFKVE